MLGPRWTRWPVFASPGGRPPADGPDCEPHPRKLEHIKGKKVRPGNKQGKKATQKAPNAPNAPNAPRGVGRGIGPTERVDLELGYYKNVASAKSTYSRLCSQLSSGGSKSSSDKGDAPISGDSKTPTKVSKRTGKVSSTSATKPPGKKGTAAAGAAAGADAGEDDVEKDEQIKVKGEPVDEPEDEANAMMSGAL